MTRAATCPQCGSSAYADATEFICSNVFCLFSWDAPVLVRTGLIKKRLPAPFKGRKAHL